MFKTMVFAALAVCAAPVLAQTSQPNVQDSNKPKMVKKQVCERVAEEQTTGSRLSSTTRVCKVVLVPAETSKQQSAQSSPR